jgi:ABC-2 type transport system permease protein
MRNAWIVAQRELGAMFVQPIAYAFAIILTLITGAVFAIQIAGYAQAAGGQFGQAPPPTMGGILGFFAFLLVFAAPAITMRLLADEQRSGTLELLMTMPVRDGEVVLGKFLAAFIFFLAVTALTLIYPFVLIRFGNPDIGPILTAYLGVILWGAGLLAIGVLASALTENQIVAFITAFGINLVLYLIAFIGRFATTNPTATTVLSEMSFEIHLGNFLQGLVTATDVLYYLIVTAVAIFAATRILESRRWR